MSRPKQPAQSAPTAVLGVPAVSFKDDAARKGDATVLELMIPPQIGWVVRWLARPS
jgi:hypothetical protein